MAKSSLTLIHFLHSGRLDRGDTDISYRTETRSEAPPKDMTDAMTKMVQCTYEIGDEVDVQAASYGPAKVVKLGRTRVTVAFEDGSGEMVFDAPSIRPRKASSKWKVSKQYYAQEQDHECPFCHSVTKIQIAGWNPLSLKPWYTGDTHECEGKKATRQTNATIAKSLGSLLP